MTKSPKEQLASFMIRNSFATGHGNTFAALLSELEWQVKERGAVTPANTITPVADRQKFEQRMLDFLYQFQPAENLRVCDVATIARHARSLFFEATS